MVTQTERLGVSKLEYYFSFHGWLFREQMTHDFGIDAQVEIMGEDYPTGEIIAIQIKSGMSFFREENSDSYIYRTDEKHINYWSNHALPVILVLYHPKNDLLYWQAINEETLKSTGVGWKVEVPKEQILDDQSLAILHRLVKAEPYIQKLNKLKLDMYWIEKVNDGNDVFIEFDDWINKSLPRYQVKLFCDGESQSWPMTYCKGMSVEDALSYLMPWADFKVDLETHEEASYSQWEAECYMGRDEEGSAYYGEPFSEWYNEPDSYEIFPYDEDGEVAKYRLRLELNKIGESFLVVHSFLEKNNEFSDHVFTLDDIKQ